MDVSSAKRVIVANRASMTTDLLQRDTLVSHHLAVFAMATVLSFIFLVNLTFFRTSTEAAIPESREIPTLAPAALYLFTAALLFCPFRIIFKDTRYAFLR